jgi:hypothetical protein
MGPRSAVHTCARRRLSAAKTVRQKPKGIRELVTPTTLSRKDSFSRAPLLIPTFGSLRLEAISESLPVPGHIVKQSPGLLARVDRTNYSRGDSRTMLGTAKLTGSSESLASAQLESSRALSLSLSLSLNLRHRPPKGDARPPERVAVHPILSAVMGGRSLTVPPNPRLTRSGHDQRDLLVVTGRSTVF